MRTHRYPVLLACTVALAAMLACSSLSTTPAVSNVRMTTDESGKTSTSSYAPGDAFFVFADLSGLRNGSVVQARWYAVNAEGMGANSEINVSNYTYEQGVSYVYFQLTTSDGGDWPAGSYRVELYLDGARVGEQGFTVQ